jgi:hypothetical protein
MAYLSNADAHARAYGPQSGYAATEASFLAMPVVARLREGHSMIAVRAGREPRLRVEQSQTFVQVARGYVRLIGRKNPHSSKRSVR